MQDIFCVAVFLHRSVQNLVWNICLLTEFANQIWRGKLFPVQMINWQQVEVTVSLKTSNACVWQNDEFPAKRCVRSCHSSRHLTIFFFSNLSNYHELVQSGGKGTSFVGVCKLHLNIHTLLKVPSDIYRHVHVHCSLSNSSITKCGSECNWCAHFPFKFNGNVNDLFNSDAVDNHVRPKLFGL